jgi:hypothetical protein
MIKPTTTFQNWRKSKGKPPSIDTLHTRKPPVQNNPSLTGGKHNRFAKPVSLPKVWK